MKKIVIFALLFIASCVDMPSSTSQTTQANCTQEPIVGESSIGCGQKDLDSVGSETLHRAQQYPSASPTPMATDVTCVQWAGREACVVHVSVPGAYVTIRCDYYEEYDEVDCETDVRPN